MGTRFLPVGITPRSRMTKVLVPAGSLTLRRADLIVDKRATHPAAMPMWPSAPERRPARAIGLPVPHLAAAESARRGARPMHA